MAASGDGIEYLLWRHVLADGEVTTVYAVRHPLVSTSVRVVHFPQPEHLDVWCRANGVAEAVVGGFFLRDPYRPLGEVWIDGSVVPHEPAAAPYASRRACVLVEPDRGIHLVAREDVPAEPAAHLLQAGPLLAAGRAMAFDADADEEGLSAGAGQFDSDITLGRYPRAALGISNDTLIAVACDGRRSNVDGGLSMVELARRWGLHDTRAPRAPPQPPVLEPGPAGAGVAPRRHGAHVPSSLTAGYPPVNASPPRKEVDGDSH